MAVITRTYSDFCFLVALTRGQRGAITLRRKTRKMTYTEAIEKAVKLLRLSKSSNPNEAALAMSKAQEIMERFKIDAASLELDKPTQNAGEPIKNFRNDPLDTSGGTWRVRLASKLARHNQCKLYTSGGLPCLVGRPSDVQTVRYFYGWLTKEIDSLTRKECAGNGRTYANNFRLGVVETVAEKLRAQQTETHARMRQEAEQEQANHNGMALMRLNMSIARIEQRAKDVEVWTKANMNLRSGSSRRRRFDSTARKHGRQAGQSIRIQPSAGNLRGATRGYLPV